MIPQPKSAPLINEYACNRQYTAALASVIVLHCLLLSICGHSSSTHPDPPNIIFIMADDLGYGDLGCYGQKIIKTPHLDQLAAEGIRFTQCYTGSPVCAPSRSVLMTGRHTGHTTVRGNFGIGGVTGLGGGAGRIPLKNEDTTVAELLQKAGYVTGMAGKWGLGEPNTTGEPVRQGFDEFFGYLNQRRAHSYYPPYLWKNREQVLLPGNQNGRTETYVHDLFTDFALDFVKRHHRSRFFLYLPYTIPHARYEIPDLGNYRDSTHWQPDAQVHAAMISRMDKDVGKLMALLKQLNIEANTVVFFCSDNGAAEIWPGRFDSSGKLRGRKRDLYEGGIRTPMIVKWPGKIPANSINHQPWHFMDLLPTLSALARADLSHDIDGLDVSPIFFDTAYTLPDRAFYWEFYERGFQQAVRWQNFKGLRLSAEGDWELYDLNVDPYEKTDVAGKYPAIVAKLAAIAAKEHIPSAHYPIRRSKKQ